MTCRKGQWQKMAELTLQKRIGRRVRLARQRKGVTLEGMIRMGFHGSHISRIESGETDVYVTTLLRIAGALEVEPGELLNGL